MNVLLKKEEAELLLSLAQDEVSRQLLREKLKQAGFKEEKREQKETKAQLELKRAIKRRKDFWFNLLTGFREYHVKNPTKGEIYIKAKLKSLGITFRFQEIFIEGVKGYIADFYLPYYNLVIEIDGSHHYTPEGKVKDEKRTVDLIKYGKVKGVIRFTNQEAYNITEEVLKRKIVEFKPDLKLINKSSITVKPKKVSNKMELPAKQIAKMTKKGQRNYKRN
jgi:very-short-patch-repair endonuclease